MTLCWSSTSSAQTKINPNQLPTTFRPSNTNGIINVDCTVYSCSDIGAGINAAYAALPTVGTPGWAVGKINVSQKSDGTCYSTSTPIALSTNGKPVNIDFNGACIQFTATSGTALTMDPGVSAVAATMWRISNLKLLGPCTTTACSGVTTVGISIGPTNGASDGQLDNVQIGAYGGAHGFFTGLTGGSNGFIYTMIQPNIIGNKTGILAGSQENINVDGGSISQNVTGFNVPSGAAIDVRFNGTSWDDNTTTAINISSGAGLGIIDLFSNHFENIGGGTCSYIASASTSVFTNLHGGIFFDQVGSGTCAQMINLAPGYLSAYNGIVVTSSGRTVTQFIKLDTSSRLGLSQVWKGANVTALYNTGSGSLTAVQDAAGSNAFVSQNGGSTTLEMYIDASSVEHIKSGGADWISITGGVATLKKGLVAGGTAAGLTGTGSCGTITTQTGGSWGGSAKCTGATGASTFIITPGSTATNGWNCKASYDNTTSANTLVPTFNATTCTLTGTVNQNDIIVFTAFPF